MTRCDRYMARVADHLPTLPSADARRSFLSNEIEKWEERFSRFQATGGQSLPGANASDFVCTISALQVERAKYQERAA